MRSGKYRIVFSKQATKDKEKLKQSGMDKRCRQILEKMLEDPYFYPPPYEKLLGDLKGMYSRRINRQHRIVYSVEESLREIRIISMWTHYENIGR